MEAFSDVAELRRAAICRLMPTFSLDDDILNGVGRYFAAQAGNGGFSIRRTFVIDPEWNTVRSGV
jgi:hypothetical protein